MGLGAGRVGGRRAQATARSRGPSPPCQPERRWRLLSRLLFRGFCGVTVTCASGTGCSGRSARARGLARPSAQPARGRPSPLSRPPAGPLAYLGARTPGASLAGACLWAAQLRWPLVFSEQRVDPSMAAWPGSYPDVSWGPPHPRQHPALKIGRIPPGWNARR